jgi:hypothetical protein
VSTWEEVNRHVRTDREHGVGLADHGERRGLGIARPNPGLPDANLAFDRKAKARFWRKVSPAPSHECWLWRGAVGNSGYGNVGRNKVTFLAHRLGYEFTYGPVPVGLDLDHLCRVKLCVNPVHLEPVTFLVNMRRRYALNPDTRPEYCLRGHRWTEFNTYIIPSNGRRRCLDCQAGTPPQASESAPAEAPPPELPAQRVMRRLLALMHDGLLNPPERTWQ